MLVQLEKMARANFCSNAIAHEGSRVLRPGVNPLEPVAVLGLNWLAPGVGFIIKGKYRQGIILFLILNTTFLIGLLLYGEVTVPTVQTDDASFNWLNILTFIGQMGNGGMSILSISLHTLAEKKNIQIFQTNSAHPWADLAVLYFLVSGAMNYFATCNLWDRVYRTPVETKGE